MKLKYPPNYPKSNTAGIQDRHNEMKREKDRWQLVDWRQRTQGVGVEPPSVEVVTVWRTLSSMDGEGMSAPADSMISVRDSVMYLPKEKWVWSQAQERANFEKVRFIIQVQRTETGL